MVKIRYIGIDPSTKTGLVALNAKGETLVAKEITGESDKDPKRMVTLVENIVNELKDTDVIAIEGFSYNSRGRGIAFQFGLGHSLRNALYSKNIDYTLVTPGQLKKYATGKGNTSKDNMAVPIFKKWKFEHKSDNVRDAYVLAQIARALGSNNEIEVLQYQLEVLEELRK